MHRGAAPPRAERRSRRWVQTWRGNREPSIRESERGAYAASSTTDSARGSIASREKAGYARVPVRRSSPAASRFRFSILDFSIPKRGTRRLRAVRASTRYRGPNRSIIKCSRSYDPGRAEVSRVGVNCDPLRRQSVASAVHGRLIPVNDFPRPRIPRLKRRICSFNFSHSQSAR